MDRQKNHKQDAADQDDQQSPSPPMNYGLFHTDKFNAQRSGSMRFSDIDVS